MSTHQSSLTRRFRRLALPTLGSALLLGSGCDDLLSELCPSEPVTVAVNSANEVSPDTAVGSVQTVNRGDSELPSLVRIPSVVIEQADIFFAGAGSGTIQLALVVDGYVATLGTLTITDGIVAGFSPTTYAIGSFSRADAQAMIAALPPAERSALNLRPLEGLTQAQIQSGVEAAVRRPSFPVGTIARVLGDLEGMVHVGQVTFNVTC